jgi:hypothetical protein
MSPSLLICCSRRTSLQTTSDRKLVRLVACMPNGFQQTNNNSQHQLQRLGPQGATTMPNDIQMANCGDQGHHNYPRARGYMMQPLPASQVSRTSKQQQSCDLSLWNKAPSSTFSDFAQQPPPVQPAAAATIDYRLPNTRRRGLQ